MALKTYDPSQLSITIGGSLISDKSWNTVAIARDEDSWTFSTGTNGEQTRTKNLNKLGTITLTLPQTSDANDILSAAELVGSPITCALIDKSGRTVVTMPQGTVMKPADTEFAKESGEREWMIKGDVPDPFLVAGN